MHASVYMYILPVSQIPNTTSKYSVLLCFYMKWICTQGGRFRGWGLQKNYNRKTLYLITICNKLWHIYEFMKEKTLQCGSF